MADYGEDLAIIVRYDGTKEQFNAVKSNYLGKVVFIYGSKDEVENQKNLVQAIWVSNESGGRYLDMANVDYISQNLTHISGITVDGNTYYPSSGGGAITLSGANGIRVTVNPVTGNVVFDAAGVKSTLIGTTSNNSDTKTHPDTIKGAKAYTDAVANNLKGSRETQDNYPETIAGAKDYADAKISDAEVRLKGTKATSDTTAETIRGAKDYADNAKKAVYGTVFGKEVVGSDDKILISRLPDTILGQLKFGGTIGNAGTTATTGLPGSNRKIIVTPSQDYINRTEAGEPFEVDETEFLADEHQGWYFIVARPVGTDIPTTALGNFSWGGTNLSPGTEYLIGDWFLSNGVEWVKIDNTDAVSSVAGETGSVSAAALADKLSSDEFAGDNALIKKSELTNELGNVVKSVGVDTDSQAYMEASTTNGAVTLGVTTEDITSETAETDGLATVADIRAYLKARLSVKVVSSN